MTMRRFAVRSVRTGESTSVWLDTTSHDHPGLCNGQGDHFGPEYIHSELFGGMGAVEIVTDDPELQAVVERLLSNSPQQPDRRVFGRCGSY